MDLANQTNVLGKINGWKIYHLKSQMEDLVSEKVLKGYYKINFNPIRIDLQVVGFLAPSIVLKKRG